MQPSPDMGPTPTNPCDLPGTPSTAFIDILETPNQVFVDNFLGTCQITEGDRPIRSDSAVINIFSADDVLFESLLPNTGMLPNTWEATIGASALPGGDYFAHCYVEDSVGGCGFSAVPFTVDGGPLVEVLAPTDLAAFSGPMSIRFTAVPQPTSAGDMDAGIASLSMTVAGNVIDPNDIVSLGNDEYQVDVDFSDATVYPLGISGEHVVDILATNDRGATGRALRSVIVDRIGPTITILQPTPAQLVGGSFDVRVRIEDELPIASGAEVIVGLEQTTFALVPVPNVPGEYVQTISAAGYGATVRELLVQVGASDVAGNTTNVSVAVKLDNQPPLASLDPPHVRYYGTATQVCTLPMDPVGDDTADDLQVLGTAAEFRARVEDIGNVAFGSPGTADFFAGVDFNSVEMLILDDTTQPLLVDTNMDGVCDAINPDVDPVAGISDGARVVTLSGVGAFLDPRDWTAQSLPPGQHWLYDTRPFEPPVRAQCVTALDGSPPNPDPEIVPGDMCITTELAWVMDSMRRNGPAIWAKGPIAPATCTGDALDFQTVVQEGWACLAVRARDNVGNVGVSPPQRNCFVSGPTSTACGGVPIFEYMPDDGSVPTCTDGCTLPPSFEGRDDDFNLIPILR